MGLQGVEVVADQQPDLRADRAILLIGLLLQSFDVSDWNANRKLCVGFAMGTSQRVWSFLVVG